MTVMGKLLGVVMVSVYLAGCGGSPTRPTPAYGPRGTIIPGTATTPTTTAVTPPPVAVPPPVILPTFPPNDARFSLSFYRMLAHNALDRPIYSLTRHAQAPRIYLRTIHANGSAIDAFTLNQTAAALENTAGALTGVFGLAGIERGTGTRAGQPGWITVSWTDDPTEQYCGRAAVGGGWVDLYTNTPECRCSGGPAVTLSAVKHELGHALGFYHTDGLDDLMYPIIRQCDQNPSEREKYHAALAYTRPIGSAAP